ncbi:MAG: FKBP-type peptidyl-prolyl cis-trans isomerase [Pygmaiobacter massiliensis]|nr:FKBP-type peptidyl-prolyl cis-trans isomerase [Pygmaiobacter massiliensis]
MNKKRIICLALALVMVLGIFAGCGSILSAWPFGDSSSSSSSSAAASSDLDYSQYLDESGFFKEVTATDVVTLIDYKNIEIPVEYSVASDEDVQTQIDYILQQYATTEQETERAVEDGDTLNIDYVGKIDGEEFDGGSTNGAGTTVTIGVTNFIDDFLEQLVGHKPGETFDINVTFPEDYGNEKLNGKDAVFTITINYIQETVVPELTDAFVAENLAEEHGATTVAELKQTLADWLVEKQEYNYVWSALTSGSSCDEIPATVSEFERAQAIQYYELSAAQMGVELTDLLSYYGYSGIDDLLTETASMLESDCKNLLYVQAIAEQEGLEVTDEEIAEYLGVEDISEHESSFGMPYLRHVTLHDKVINLMLDNAVRADAQPADSESAASQSQVSSAVSSAAQ